MVLFLAPLPTLMMVAKEKSTQNLPLLPYSSMVCSSILWVTYGLMKQDPRIWSGNGVGLIMGLVYLATFVRNHQTSSSSDAEKSNLPGTVSQHVNAVGAVALMTAYLASRQLTDVVGVLAMVFCVIMFGSPLAATKLVMQTKSSAHIPWPFTMASFTSCALWSVSGIFDMKDVAVIVPNVLGFALSTMQVLLKWIFPGEPSKASPNVPPL
jgi:solute carrier family 50 protein (sugar transporter)